MQGQVTLSVLDGGGSLVTVPSSSVQTIIGPSSAGTANQPFISLNQATIVANIGYGPLLEAVMMIINGGGNGLPGGIPIICKATQNAAGTVVGASQAAVTIASLTNGPPAALTVSGGHNLVSGAIVTITGATGDTAINGTWVATVTSSTVFTIPVTGTGSYSANSASVQFTGVIYSGTGTSVPTVTLNATIGSFDGYYVQWTCTTAGTVGTAGIAFTLSLDANRNAGPVQQLGMATTYAIANTGITLNFTSSQTFVVGDYFRFATSGPSIATSGIQSALSAIQASPYANSGWGADTLILMAQAGTDATTTEGYLDTLANAYLYTRALTHTVDASVPTSWGGPGQTATSWATAIQSSYSAVSSKRICCSAGNYNMPSVTQAQAPVVPSVTYRRPLSWALAARQVGIPPQRSAGRVRDASLQNIVINPATDPTDGFVYWDERIQGGSLTSARFSAATTRVPNLPGFFILVGPNLMSPSGSQFVILPQGNVIDEASSIFIQAAQQEINEDVLTNLVGGTLTAAQAAQIEADILAPLTNNMVNTQQIQGAFVVVDTTNNVQATMNVNIACVIVARGYIETITASISLAAAQAA